MDESPPKPAGGGGQVSEARKIKFVTNARLKTHVFIILSQERKSQLDDLPREELIVKCKNLLAIAKKAKAAKDGKKGTR